RGPTVAALRRVDPPACTDAGERHCEDEAEREARAAEDRSQHPVPDELELEKDDPGDGRSRVKERARNARACYPGMCGERNVCCPAILGWALVLYRLLPQAARDRADADVQSRRRIERRLGPERFEENERREHGARDS